MKKIKPHGMSSEKASRVKIRGHKKEFIYAALIGGKVIQGTKKQDVMDSFGKIHSVKGGGEIKGGEGRKGKWQVFLHKLSKFEEDINFYGGEIFIKILKSYPISYEEYVKTKAVVKSRIIQYVKELKKYLFNETNKYNFLNKAFFDERVDYFVVYHDDTFYVFDSSEAIKIFVKLLLVDNSSSFQKIVFKHDNKIAAEIEVRTTNDGKYPSILFNMLKLKALDILTKNVSDFIKINPNLYVYGIATKSFKI